MVTTIKRVKPIKVVIVYDSLILSKETFDEGDIDRGLRRANFFISDIAALEGKADGDKDYEDVLSIFLDCLDCTALADGIPVYAKLLVKFSNGHKLVKIVKFTELGLVENGQT